MKFLCENVSMTITSDSTGQEVVTIQIAPWSSQKEPTFKCIFTIIGNEKNNHGGNIIQPSYQNSLLFIELYKIISMYLVQVNKI